MDLPEEIQQKFSSEPLTKKYATLTKKEEEERFHIQNVLRQTQGKKTEAAKLLGYSRVTLWKKIRKFELED
jgi:transcriptional regulator of acetoin/glycerol metabolism